MLTQSRKSTDSTAAIDALSRQDVLIESASSIDLADLSIVREGHGVERGSLENWQRAIGAGLISDTGRRVSPRGELWDRVAARTAEPGSLSELFQEMGMTSAGRQLIRDFSSRYGDFEAISSAIQVCCTPPPGAPLPLSLCRGATSTGSKLAPHLSNLDSTAFAAWLVAAINPASAVAREMVRSLQHSLQKAQVTFCSYNVWGTHGVLGLDKIFGFASKSPERFEYIGRELRQRAYGVVTLQEMWHPHTEKIIQASAYPYVSRAVVGKGMWQKPGLVTLSQHPILETEFRRFKSRGGHERYVGKGALRTRVLCQPLGQLVDIYNVHLVSPPEKLPLFGSSEVFHALLRDPTSEQIRAAQVSEISSFISEVIARGAEVPYLLLGDCNAPEGSVAYQLLCHRVGTDLFRARSPKIVPSDFTFDVSSNRWLHGRDEASGRLDYAFISPRFEVSAVGMELTFNTPHTTFSDHYGLAGSLILAGKGEQYESAIRAQRSREWPRFEGSRDFAGAVPTI